MKAIIAHGISAISSFLSGMGVTVEPETQKVSVDLNVSATSKPARKSRAKVKVKLTGVEITARDLEAHRKATTKRLKKAPVPEITRQQRRAADRQAAKGSIYRDERTGTEYYV